MLCYRLLENQSDAKDAVQEVFIKLWNQKGKLLELKSVEAYARTIARNHCFDLLRLKKQFVEINEESNGTIVNLVDEEYSTDTSLKVNMVKYAVAKLNSVQQKVFVMRDIEGCEFDEIANEMGLSSENVRVIVSRARKSIREMVSQIQKKQEL